MHTPKQSFFASNKWNGDLKVFESRWPFIMYTLVITILSLFPRERIPSPEWTMMDGVDKLIHALFYGLMYFLWHRMKKSQRVSAPLWGLLVCIAWGLLMELLQGFMSYGRAFEYTDILANAAGVLIAFIIFRNK